MSFHVLKGGVTFKKIVVVVNKRIFEVVGLFGEADPGFARNL